MTSSPTPLTDLLREVPLFSSLTAQELERLGESLVPIELEEGEWLYQAGEPTTGVYLVESGSLALVEKGSGQQSLCRRAAIVGNEALRNLATREATATAQTSARLLFLDNAQIRELLLANPRFRETNQVMLGSQELIRRVPMPWLEPDEHVNVMTRKHPVFLLGKALIPLLFFLGVIFTANWLLAVSSIFAMIVLLSGFLLSLAWLAWNINNWANDFYLITNKRMVWVERVSGLYDSRQEAPLGTLLSVGIKTTQLGVFLGYSDVVVRTYIGDIRFERVAHARAIGKLVEAYWARGKQVDLDLDAKEIRSALRRKFGKDIGDVSTEEMRVEARATAEAFKAETPVEPSFFDWLFSDFFKVRFEAGGTITYRKHWFVLLRNAIGPWLGLMLSAAFTVALVTHYITRINYAMGFVLGVFLMIVFILTLLYVYVDWHNDVFQLTPNQVVDIDRKPFGRESKRSASLDNILSIEYERRGLIPMLCNFGTVYISVGNTQLTFNEVYQPSVVQQDIFARMGARNEEKQQLLTSQERERVAQWFKIFQEETQPQAAATDTTHKLNSTLP